MEDRDIEIFQGIKYGPLVLTARDAAGIATSLVGWTVYAVARLRRDAEVAFDLVPTITNAAAGEITIVFTDEETADLIPGRYGWDMVLANSSGERFGPFVGGAVYVSRNYTQP